MPTNPCPGLNPGCRCRECFGLAEYMQQITGKTYGLRAARRDEQAQPTRVIDMPCQSMTCQCARCTADRAQARARTIRQPWHPRQAA